MEETLRVKVGNKGRQGCETKDRSLGSERTDSVEV